MKARLLLLACCLLPALTLPLEAAPKSVRLSKKEVNKLYDDMQKQQEQKAAKKASNTGFDIDPSKLSEEQQHPYTDCSAEWFLNYSSMRTGNKSTLYKKGKAMSNVVNDFFGENAEDTGEYAGLLNEELTDAKKSKRMKWPKAKRVSSEKEAVTYVLQMAEQCANPICIKLKSLNGELGSRILKWVFARGLAHNANFLIEKDEMAFIFSYTDDARIKAHHAGHLPASELSKDERASYIKAMEVVVDFLKQFGAIEDDEAGNKGDNKLGVAADNEDQNTNLTSLREKLKSADKAKLRACEYDLAVALHDYLVSTCEYDMEEYQKIQQGKGKLYGATTTMLLEGHGVCNAYMRAYAVLLDIAGIESEFISGGNHAWNVVKLEDEWTHVDATWDDPVPDVPNRVLHQWFGMPSKEIRKSHVWNKAIYPYKADTEKLYYPERVREEAPPAEDDAPLTDDKMADMPRRSASS